MRYALLVAATLTVGCGGSSPEPTPAAPKAPAAAKAPAALPDYAAPPTLTEQAPESLNPDRPIFSFILRTHKGRRTGTRVWIDGRVEVLQAAPGRQGQWKPSDALDEAALRDMWKGLEEPALATLPSKLPTTPDAAADAPRATWTFQVNGVEKTVIAEKWQGVRSPLIQRLHSHLLQRAPQQSLSTEWTFHPSLRSEGLTIPCQPTLLPKTSTLMRYLNDRTNQEVETPGPAETTLSVQFTEGDLTWRTTLREDGIVAHTLPNGSMMYRQLAQSRWDWIRAEIPRIDWDALSGKCPKR